MEFTNNIWVAIIVAVPSVLATLAAIIGSLRNSKKIDESQDKINAQGIPNPEAGHGNMVDMLQALINLENENKENLQRAEKKLDAHIKRYNEALIDAEPLRLFVEKLMAGRFRRPGEPPDPTLEKGL